MGIAVALRIDRYSFHARALPVYVTLAPIVLVLAAVAPDDLRAIVGGSAAALLVPLSFLLSQLGADFGKRLEGTLWQAWGGPPSTRFLRHGNQEFNAITRGRVHDQLRALGLAIPSPEEQAHSLVAADRCYQSCAEDLIRRTRDISKYPLVFKSLTEYGFRRNLLGLKRVGLLISIAGLLILAWAAYAAWSGGLPVAAPAILAIPIVGLLITWVVWVTEPTVRLAADRYARFLLEAALDVT